MYSEGTAALKRENSVWDFAALAACVLFCYALKGQNPGAVGNAHRNNAGMIPFLILAHNKNKRSKPAAIERLAHFIRRTDDLVFLQVYDL